MIVCIYIVSSGGSVVGEEYVLFLVDNFDVSLVKIWVSGVDVVFIILVGGVLVSFNCVFVGFGLVVGIICLGILIEENMLVGIGV